MEEVNVNPRTSSELIQKPDLLVGGGPEYDLNNNTVSPEDPHPNQAKDTNMNAGHSRSSMKKDEHPSSTTSTSKSSVKGKKKKKAAPKKSASSTSKGKGKENEAAAVNEGEEELPFEEVVSTVNQSDSIDDLDKDDYSTLIRKAVAAILSGVDPNEIDNDEDGSQQTLQTISSLSMAVLSGQQNVLTERQHSDPTLKKTKKKATGIKKGGTARKRSTISIFADGTMVVHPSTATSGRTVQLNRLLTATARPSSSRLIRKATKSDATGGAKEPKRTKPIGKDSQIAKSFHSIPIPSTRSRVKRKPPLPAAATPSRAPPAPAVIVPDKAKVSKPESATNAAHSGTTTGTKLKPGKSKSFAAVRVEVTASKPVPAVQKKTSGNQQIGEQKQKSAVGVQSEVKVKISPSTADDNTGQSIYNVSGFKIAPPAQLTKKPNMWDISLYLTRIQNYYHVLGYQRQGEPKIVVNTHASIRNLNETAKKLIRAGEPIKCLHALVLSIYFTNGSLLVERFPINFKSKYNGREYKHVVLGIYMFGRFGALGISRDLGLQSKSVDSVKLADLLENFHKAYAQSGHQLLEIKVGGAITHDQHSLAAIQWKLGPIVDYTKSPEVIQSDIHRVYKLLRSQMGQICLKKTQPDTNTINPKTVTKEYILKHTSVQLHRVARTASEIAKPKTTKSEAAQTHTDKTRTSVASASNLSKFSTATATAAASTSASVTATASKSKKGTKKAFK